MSSMIRNLKGFRDFLPAEKNKRDIVKTKIIQTFQNFAFSPLETPTIEYAELLLGKYGNEADKLVYQFADRGQRQVALRYDQTVPTARILSQYRQELPKFFRRYQIQNVFRAEKPQKGRYREFTQADIDIFGSQSPLADAEIIACLYSALKNIGFREIIVQINDRSTLINALSPFANDQVNVMSIIQSIDKLDKLSPEDVQQELMTKGLSPAAADQALSAIKNSFASENLQKIEQLAQALGIPKNDLKFTPTLARGLDYYTGMIFELRLPQYAAGSVGGGGRYDRLIGQLSGYEIEAVGGALGFDRLVEAAEQLGLLNYSPTAQVLLTIFSPDDQLAIAKIARQLRAANINAEIYPQSDKLSKQLKLANQKQIPFVIIVGEEEQKQNRIVLKNMANGKQQSLTLAETISFLQKQKK